jgi:alkylation response protein AidB-like acyl-CoA dehydrogenase
MNDALAAVDAMVPRLRERAAHAEELRRLPEETVREAAEGGFLGMLTPRRWGGSQCDFPTFLEATRRLATACPSSAWTLAFLALHAWLLCRFEPRLQEEVFASGPAPRTPALGAAEGALDAFTGRMREKIQAYSGQKQVELPATHLRLGEGLATERAARLVWSDAIRTLARIGPAGPGAPTEDRAAIRLAGARVVRLANEAANGHAAGASSGFLTSPLQRHLRDLQMIRGHVVFDWDRAAQIGGKIALGIEPTPADLL